MKILEKTIPLVPEDAYCMLSVTMQDLYPNPAWSYVFGMGEYEARTGVFSFLRYDPLFYGLKDDRRDINLLRNSCGIMVHEIGHMFAIKHCIYFNCIMNGINSYKESTRAIRYLCPVCMRKL